MRSTDLVSEIEKYLRETGCDMLTYLEHLMAGFPVGAAFLNTLGNGDIHWLRIDGAYADIQSETEEDSPLLLQAIEYLKEKQ
jgi:hypothetical protein